MEVILITEARVWVWVLWVCGSGCYGYVCGSGCFVFPYFAGWLCHCFFVQKPGCGSGCYGYVYMCMGAVGKCICVWVLWVSVYVYGCYG